MRLDPSILNGSGRVDTHAFDFGFEIGDIFLIKGVIYCLTMTFRGYFVIE